MIFVRDDEIPYGNSDTLGFLHTKSELEHGHSEIVDLSIQNCDFPSLCKRRNQRVSHCSKAPLPVKFQASSEFTSNFDADFGELPLGFDHEKH